MAGHGTFQKLRPLALLTHLSSCYDSANLQVFSGSVSWSIYIEEGKITYASHSVDPFERLERHLRRLDNQSTTIDSETFTQLRLMFETGSSSQSTQNHDYEAIRWLVNHQYLELQQAGILIEKLVKEVIESFLLVKEGTYELGDQPDALPEFCRLELQPIVEYCQKQLQGWQSLGPQIWSPYQRPYFFCPTRGPQELLPEHQQKYSVMLKGFSFRHLAVLLNQDELQLAQSLHPYIIKGSILLHEPLPPFEQLPKTFEQLPKQLDLLPKPLEQISKPFKQSLEIGVSARKSFQEVETLTINTVTEPLKVGTPATKSLPKLQTPISTNAAGKIASPLAGKGATKKAYTIVCVDDSPAMLKEISNFLDDESFSVFTVNKPVKALMEIVRRKPDLILLDVRMETLDGYELCRLLRNHPLFKNTPIIMVTGNKGIIDKVKAKMVGSSDYLTKPFTQKELLKIMFKYLT